MTDSLFFRLLKDEEKDARLREVIQSLRSTPPKPPVHPVAQGTFRMIPGAPFAYWVSDAMRRKFTEFPRLEGNAGSVRQGLATADDFRFVRASWEVPVRLVGQTREDTNSGKPWVAFAKGGEYAPFCSDVHLLADWHSEGASIKTNLNTRGGVRSNVWMLRDTSRNYFFRPGLTWPLRTDGLSFRLLPEGCVFSHKGPALFAAGGVPEQTLALAALLNSRATLAFVQMLLARTELAQSFEVGLVQSLPIPDLRATQMLLGVLARSIHDTKSSLDTASENSHAFVLPALLQQSGATLGARLEGWNKTIDEAGRQIVKAQRQIDEICYRLYGIGAEDRATIEAELGTEVRGLPEPLTGAQAAADLVSWMLGVVVGRFDVRLATGERAIPDPPDPFAPLPPQSAGMLPEGRLPTGYPIAVDEDGILADDEGHADDLVARVREVLHLLWKDQADVIEKEACALLGVKSLREYFGKVGKGGFWDDHFRRYTKSRRRAPILWPLQSPRGFVRVWLYAHRLTKDTLPKVLGTRYLGGMLAQAKHAIEELRPGGQAKPGLTKKEEKRLADLDERLVDLEGFAAMIRVAIQRTNDRGETVGYVPDLNDGVVLAAAPLHEMIPWPKTRKQRGQTVSELRAYWEELAEGEYDWAHVAMLYWPTRVREKCQTDKSLALAHGLDAELFPGLREELRRQADTATTGPEGGVDEDEAIEDEEDTE